MKSHVYLMRAKDEVYKSEVERVIESGKLFMEENLGVLQSPSRLILYIYPYKF
jgi:hypothetical protein